MRLLALRNIGYLLLLGLVLTVERVIGLPILFVAGSLLFLARFKHLWHRVVVVLILSWWLAVVFHLAFIVSILLLLGSWWFFLQGSGLLKSSRLRLLSVVLLSCVVVGVLKQFSLSWLQITVSGLSMSILLFVSRAMSFGEHGPHPSGLRWDKRVWQIPELLRKS